MKDERSKPNVSGERRIASCRPNREKLRRALLWLGLGIWFVATSVAVLYPFGMRPENHVVPVIGSPGLEFSGEGIAYSRQPLRASADSPLTEITIAVWLHEPASARNWGPRSIVAITDGRHVMPLTLGVQAKRLFLYNPNGERRDSWYTQFQLAEPLERDKDHFVAVTMGAGSKQIYVDDRTVERRALTPKESEELLINGKVIVGNSPSANRGWWGLIRGLAILDRALDGDRLDALRLRAERDGLDSLADVPGIVMLVSWNTNDIRVTEDIAATRAGSGQALLVPKRLSALSSVLWTLPTREMMLNWRTMRDLILNVALFFPLGWLALSLCRPHARRFLVAAGVLIVCCGALMSLGLEALQLHIPQRSPAATDIITNTLGTALGALVGGQFFKRPRIGGVNQAVGSDRNFSDRVP